MKRFFISFMVLTVVYSVTSCGGEEDDQESSVECNNYASGAYECRYGDSYICNSVHEWVKVETCYDGCDWSTGKCYLDEGNSGNTGDTGDTGNSGNSGDTGDSTCEPDCAGRECGSDGCGGSCGTCNSGYDCTASGQCVKNDSCVDNNDCDDSMFCYQNTCQTPWGKYWEVTFISAQVSEKDPENEAWDPSGGLPDLYAALEIEDDVIFNTGTVDDSTTATWNYSETVLFEASTETIYFCLMDEDVDVVDDDDYIICAYRSNQVSLFREQNIDFRQFF